MVLQTYLQAVELPCLSASQRALLEAPIKIEELQEAISLSHNSKPPGMMASQWKFISNMGDPFYHIYFKYLIQPRTVSIYACIYACIYD